jgi:hypothetical protein
MAGGGENGAHDQRAMEEGRKEEHPAADQGCAMASVPFAQKVRPPGCLLAAVLGFLSSPFSFLHALFDRLHLSF